jgi:prepilin-type N-terminal cleavage/methylation domain-containing protein
VRVVPFAVRQRVPRSGVTLIELLVVMAIIGTLAALTVGAVVKVRASQEKSFTETTISKLASALDQQWKAVMDQAREEPIPPAVIAMANNDPRRAKVIYTKLRLQQEFPINFWVAINPTRTQNVGVVAKPSYAVALNGMNPSQTNPAAWESSACLYMALKQGRRGMAAFNPDDAVDANFIRSASVALPGGGSANFKYFVDVWGNPLRLYDFPTGCQELNNPPYVNTVLAASQRDPQDPEGTLSDPAWNSSANNNVLVFNAALHALVAPGTQPPKNAAFYLIPVIASAGKDGNWGIDARDMTPTSDDANDNIYSFRLRKFGQRGD